MLPSLPRHHFCAPGKVFMNISPSWLGCNSSKPGYFASCEVCSVLLSSPHLLASQPLFFVRFWHPGTLGLRHAREKVLHIFWGLLIHKSFLFHIFMPTSFPVLLFSVTPLSVPYSQQDYIFLYSLYSYSHFLEIPSGRNPL